MTGPTLLLLALWLPLGLTTRLLRPTPPASPVPPTLAPNQTVWLTEPGQSTPASLAESAWNSSEADPSVPFEVLIRNDKTMAHLKFDLAGREVVKCVLYDLEKQVAAAEVVPGQTGLKPPLDADFETMLEAVRRCTALARAQHSLDRAGAEDNSTQEWPSVTPPANHTGPTDSPPDANSTSKAQALDLASLVAFWKGIVPGTKWCGLGDMASQYEDVGPKLDIDVCCRAHDHCPIRLKALRKAYGVFNFSLHTRSHCECDQDFYRCLKKSANTYAHTLGHFYFNVLQVQCLQHQSAVVCLRKRQGPPEECLQYGPSANVTAQLVPFEPKF